MELRDYFRQRGWALLILLVLPLIAGLAAYSVLRDKPQQFDGVVQVAVPEVFANSDSRIGLYIADFAQGLTDGDLVDQVHKATGVSTDDLASLGAARVQLSSRLEVDLTSSSSSRATRDAVVAAAKAGRLKLANQGLNVQQAAVAQAQQQLDKAQAALADYQNQIGTLFPSDSYQAAQASVRNLENSRVDATATGNTVRVAALTAQIKTLQTQLATLTPQVRQAQVLTNAISSATTNLRTVQQGLTDRQNLATTASNDDGLSAITSTPQSRTLPLVEGIVVAMVVALLLGLAILLVPDLLRRPENRRRRRSVQADSGAAPMSVSDRSSPVDRSSLVDDRSPAADRSGAARGDSGRKVLKPEGRPADEYAPVPE